MNILHYSLGFPPFRRGGMTKYCIDLIEEQLKLGHNVGMLWPGRIKKYGYGINIKELAYERINNNLVCRSYEIINPLPVPLLNGIVNFKEFTQKKDESIFYYFFKEKEIEIIHIHTLMGLPKECIDAAKRLNIRLIYTTHDYFGICPKWGLIHNGNICENDFGCKRCIECNKSALSLKKIKILQSNIYRHIKDLKIVSNLRKNHNDKLYKESNNNNLGDVFITDDIIKTSQQYKKLREFYIYMLKSMDVIHFNSSNTEKIFNKYFSTYKNGTIIPITHSSISDNRKIRKYGEKLRIGYLGPITEHKGFFALRRVCDELYCEYKNKFELHIFSQYFGEEKYIIKHNSYKYDQLEQVMDSIDVLVVPSLWNETFGFTVLEALSYGIPVIVSNHVGAKDLIKNKSSGIILDDFYELRRVFIEILESSGEVLKKMNDYIIKNTSIQTIEKHTMKIIDCYNELTEK